MFESKAWEFTPTGRGEASDTARHATVLETESPAFEVAKFWWNNLVADDNKVNLLGGITHMPLAYPSGKVRLAVNQYLVYERRALDYISPVRTAELLGETDERYFRLGEPQGLVPQLTGPGARDGRITFLYGAVTLGLPGRSPRAFAATGPQGTWLEWASCWS